jgi:hypothetical protein
MITSVEIIDRGTTQWGRRPSSEATPGGALFRASINFWIDALAFLCLLVTAVSGMALMHIHPGENEGMTWGISSFIWLPLLNLIGWIFVASVIFHLAVRRGFVALMLSARLCSNRGAAAREGPIGINNL